MGQLLSPNPYKVNDIDDQHDNGNHKNSSIELKSIQIKLCIRRDYKLFNLRVAVMAVEIDNSFEPVPVIVALPSQINRCCNDPQFANKVKNIPRDCSTEIHRQVDLFIAHWIDRRVEDPSDYQDEDLDRHCCHKNGHHDHSSSVGWEKLVVELASRVRNTELSVVVMATRVSPTRKVGKAKFILPGGRVRKSCIILKLIELGIASVEVDLSLGI